AIARIAQGIIENGGRPEIRPRLITTGAEVQTPRMRKQIAEAFRAPVYNVYGAHEFNLLAWECCKTGLMHTCDDLLVLEVIRGDKPAAAGERGEVVCTSLHSYAMPFIRHRLDDVAMRGPDACPCGAPFGVFAQVLGRMFDH